MENPYFLLILATLFWGGNFTLGRAISGSIPPMTLSYLRWIEALIFFIPFAWQEVKLHHDLIKKNLLTFILLGVTGVVGFNMCVYLAVQYTTAINASLINASTPMIVSLFSIYFLKETISSRQGMGLLISFCGVLWIIIKGNVANLMALSFNKGDIIMLIAVILWGFYNVVLKSKGNNIPPKVLFVFSILGGLIITLPLVIFENMNLGLNWIVNLEYYHYLSLIYFGIFPTILSFLFFNKAMLKIGASRASIFANLIVFFASLFSILFLGESLNTTHFLGGGLIISGVYLTTQIDKKEIIKEI